MQKLNYKIGDKVVVRLGNDSKSMFNGWMGKVLRYETIPTDGYIVIFNAGVKIFFTEKDLELLEE